MNNFTTKIITPDGEKFNDKIESVTVPAFEGSLGVLYQHTPMITKLKKGVAVLTQENKKLYFVLSAGILEVDENHNVMMLVDSAQKAESLEEAQSKLIEVS